MVMVADVLPGLKRWLKPLGLSAPVALMVTRVVAAFVHHVGRMSCLQAAGSSRWRKGDGVSSTVRDPLCLQIAAALRSHGYLVDEGVGQSHFRVDLAVRRTGDAVYRLGILVDTLTQYEQSEPLERDMMRPRLLHTFGWQVTSVLAKDWYEDQAAELRGLLELLADQP